MATQYCSVCALAAYVLLTLVSGERQPNALRCVACAAAVRHQKNGVEYLEYLEALKSKVNDYMTCSTC